MKRLSILAMVVLVAMLGCSQSASRPRAVDPGPQVPWQESFAERLGRTGIFPKGHRVTVSEYKLYQPLCLNHQGYLEKRIEWQRRAK